ncbi:MAG: hypothetical protein ACJAYG_001533 [Oceanicoccus sp.]
MLAPSYTFTNVADVTRLKSLIKPQALTDYSSYVTNLVAYFGNKAGFSAPAEGPVSATENSLPKAISNTQKKCIFWPRRLEK